MLNKGIAKLKNQRQLRDIHEASRGLTAWFATPAGRRLLAEELQVLEPELSCLFGYHLMQLSVSAQISLYDESRVNHCFALGLGLPAADDKVAAGVSLEALPFADESIDVTLLHHVLEFSSHPHQILREACRVTISKGYIIILGFNPYSLAGFIRPAAQISSKNSIWKRREISKNRLEDWLKFLDCNTLKVTYGGYLWPFSGARYVRLATQFGRKIQGFKLPIGDFYCLVARKDRLCMTPIKPDWSRKLNLKSVKTAITAPSAARDPNLLSRNHLPKLKLHTFKK